MTHALVYKEAQYAPCSSHIIFLKNEQKKKPTVLFEIPFPLYLISQHYNEIYSRSISSGLNLNSPSSVQRINTRLWPTFHPAATVCAPYLAVY